MLHRTQPHLPLEAMAVLPAEPDGVSFPDIARFLRRHFLLIAGCFGCAAAVAIFFVYTAQHRFTARAQILIDPSATQVLRDPAAGPERSLDTAQVEGQVAVLRSESLAIYVIGKLNLIDDPEFRAPPQSYKERMVDRIKDLIDYGGRRAALSKAELKDDTEYERLRTAVDVFLGNLDVRRVGTSYAIDISCTSGDPNKAAKIANAVADAYIQDQLKAASQAAQKSSEWLEARLTQLREQLNTAARQLDLFKSGRDLRLPGTQGDMAPTAPAPSQAGASNPMPQGKAPAAAPSAGGQRDPAFARGQLTLAELESTTESYRKIYEAYQQAFTEAVQRQSFPVSNARVITTATRPLTKSSPRGRLILAFAGLAGVLVGLALAFIRQALDHTVRSATQIRAKVGLPCLALIPRLGRPSRFSPPGLTGSYLPLTPPSKAPKLSRLAAAMPSTLPADYNFRIAIDVPFSPFSNALKTLRTTIAHADPRLPMRCVGITSAMPREGKSMVAGNLATLYALSSGRTLIIDADIHNSTVSRYFAPGVTAGLLEVVTGVAALDKAIIKGSGFVPDVLPIAVKEAAPVSYEQLASEKMQALLHALRGRYDMVVVDLPPVNPVVDGVSIAALLDGVVIVAEWGRTPVELLAEVATTLSTAQVNVLGVVISKADPSIVTLHWRKDWGYGYYPMAAGRRRTQARR
jgi:capsular exopolysaccharide synthesis family protein